MPLKVKTILITGATGFIGQHLLDNLKGGNYRIKVLSRIDNPSFWSANKDVHVYKGNIVNKDSLEKAVSETDIIIHLAAAIDRMGELEDTNIMGTENIIALANKHDVKRIIHLSSVGVVGMQYSLRDIVIDESSSCDPKNEYEKTKWIAEQKLVEAASTGKWELIALRPTNVFGEYHPRNPLLGLFLHLKNKKNIIAAEGAMLNYVYVKEVANVIRFFIDAADGYAGKYNVGKAVPLPEFISSMGNQIGIKPVINEVPALFFAIANALNYLGQERLKEKTRALSNHVSYSDHLLRTFLPEKHSLETGLANVYNHFKEKGLL